MKRNALLPLLMFIPGCSLFAPEEEAPYIAHPWSQSAFHALSFDHPIRAVFLPSGQAINVLRSRDTEVLEIKCPVEETTQESVPTGTRIRDSRRKQVVGTSVERVTTDACALEAIRACRWITRNGRSTFSREIAVYWWGGRHVGYAFYVRCLTPSEFETWARSPAGSEARVSPHAEPMLRDYLRSIEAQKSKKHSDTKQVTP